MVVVTEEDEAVIRAVYRQRGEFAAAIELRRLFPGITDNAQAREWARTIVGWKPLPEPAAHFLAGREGRHHLVAHLDRQAGGTTDGYDAPSPIRRACRSGRSAHRCAV
jgi:hypothetical protein